MIDHDYEANLNDTIQNYSDECSDSEIDNFVKEQGMNKSNLSNELISVFRLDFSLN